MSSAETLETSSRSLFLVFSRDGQNKSKCSRVPSTCDGTQAGRRQKPDLFSVQCLCSLSVKYLPESILAAVTALWHSNGLEPHEDQIGWGLVRDINVGLKYGMEVSLDASSRRIPSQ